MIAALAASCLLATVQPSPILPFERILDPSGAVILVRTEPELATVNVHLFASSRGVSETPATHGHRHLLEHVLVRQNGSFDIELESSGWDLSARTFRDAMEIKLEGTQSGFGKAMRILGDIVGTKSFEQAHIARELLIIDQELALASSIDRALATNWLALYGPNGLDPTGASEALRNASPETLKRTFHEVFAVDQLVLVVVGPVAVESVRATASAVFSKAPKARKAEFVKRDSQAGKYVVTSHDSGSMLTFAVDRYSSTQTAQTLAIGFATMAKLKGTQFIFVPSLQPGSMSLALPDSSADVDKVLASLTDAELANGLAFAKQWVIQELSNPISAAFARGFLQSQAFGARPETMLEALDGVTVGGIRNRLTELKRINKEQP